MSRLASFLKEHNHSELKIKSGKIRLFGISDYANLGANSNYKKGVFAFQFNIVTENGDNYAMDTAFVHKNILDGQFSATLK